MSRNIKLFVFTGRDVREKGPDILKSQNRRGYSLLPLDVSGIGYATAAGVPFTLIDDWIGTDNIPVAFGESVECSYGWFESAREEFTVDGICWPEFDQHAMHWFWIAASLAKSLSKAFLKQGVQELRYGRAAALHPGLFYSPSDVHGAFWSSAAADIAKPYGLSRWKYCNDKLSGLLNSMRNIALKYSSRNSLKTGRVQDLSENSSLMDELGNKIIMVFNPGEIYRFTPIIRGLADSFPGQLALIALSGDKQQADEISRQFGIPAHPMPFKAEISIDLKKRFRNALNKTRELSDKKPWADMLKYLSFHFEYYCDYRWPLLAADFSLWSEFLKGSQPSAVVISSLEDAESMLPGKAAMRNTILSISIPHGAIQSKTTAFAATEYVLQDYPIQRKLYEKAGIPSERIITCRSNAAENEHAVETAVLNHKEHLWNIVCLFNCIGTPGNLPFAGQASQLKALETLDNPPSDIRDKIHMFLKTHPSPEFADLELFNAVSDRLKSMLLPLNSALSDVLGAVDLVIAVNYSGSALIHALRYGKPVILFYNNPLIGKAGLNTTGELFADAGVLIRREKDLWDAVRTFFSDQETAEEMQRKARKFYQAQLDNSLFPSINEVMRDIVSGKPAPVN